MTRERALEIAERIGALMATAAPMFREQAVVELLAVMEQERGELLVALATASMDLYFPPISADQEVLVA